MTASFVAQATFYLTSNKPDPDYQWRMVGNATWNDVAANASQFNLTEHYVQPGRNLLEARAIYGAAADPTPTVYSWFYDPYPPNTTITAGLTGGERFYGQNATFAMLPQTRALLTAFFEEFWERTDLGEWWS